MRIGIHQPNYVPWCGYFAKMAAVDVFVFLDNVQMSKGSYINRAKIADAAGGEPRWLTVPCSWNFGDTIDDVKVAGESWSDDHRRRLSAAYSRSPHFDEVMQVLEPCYSAADELVDVNLRAIDAIARFLGIAVETRRSSTMELHGARDERLIEIVQLLGGDTYVSGKGGANYQDPAKFRAGGISLEMRQYAPLPYDQGHHERFTPGLSIVDALFRIGRDARGLLRYPE